MGEAPLFVVKDERFQIRRHLGSGGMGDVYEAFDRQRGGTVALKTMSSLDGDRLYLFKNEFRVLADLHHPNLVHLYELFHDGRTWYFTMELLDGVGLLDYVRPVAGGVIVLPTSESADTTARDRSIRGGSTDETFATQEVDKELLVSEDTRRREQIIHATVDLDRLRATLQQLADALHFLHQSGKVHRDVKPSNVMVTPEGRVVLLDFGLATEARAEGHDDGRLIGSPSYMAPERLGKGAMLPAGDWYSFGVLLYEALTGDVPYRGGTVVELVQKKRQYSPPPPRAINPALPEDLDQLCMDLLRADPERRPPPSEILERLGIRSATQNRRGMRTATLFTGQMPFVGRTEELELLRKAFQDTRKGRAVIMVVDGESGVGKSELVRHFVNECQTTEGSITFMGRCYEREALPYKAFDGIADALSHYMVSLGEKEMSVLVPPRAGLLTRLFPVLRRVRPIAEAPVQVHEVQYAQEQRARMFRAFRELLTAVAERKPLVLVIDDLQWADADSRTLLAEMMHPSEAPPVLLLVTRRSDLDAAASADILSDLREADVRRMTLPALSHSATVELVQKLQERLDSHERIPVEAVLRETGGMPLFVQELVLHREAGPGGGMRLDDALWARVEKLPEGPRLVLELVVVAGSPLPQEVILQAASGGAQIKPEDIGLLRIAHLVRTSSKDMVEPYHDRVREAVIHHISPDQLRAHHRSIASALERGDSANTDPNRLLRHLEASGQAERAARLAEDAAERASAAFAFDRAAELYQAALRLGEYDDATVRKMRIKLGTTLANAGRGYESAEVFTLAADGADHAVRLDCRRQAADQLLACGYVAQGIEAVSKLLHEIGYEFSTSSTRALTSVLSRRAWLGIRGFKWREREAAQIPMVVLTRLDVFRAVSRGLGVVDHVRGGDFQIRGLLLALKAGERHRLAVALFYEVAYLTAKGGRGWVKGREMAERAIEMTKSLGDPYMEGWRHAAQGFVEYFAARFARSTEEFREAERIYREETAGSSWELNTVRLFSTWAALRQGAFRRLKELQSDYRRDAVRRGDRYAESTLRRACNAVWLVEDRVEDARRDLDEDPWPPPGETYHLQHWYGLRARAEIALYEGRPETVMDSFEVGLDGIKRAFLTQIQFVRTESIYLKARLLLARGDLGPARFKAIARIAKTLRGEPISYSQVWASMLDAGIAIARGRTEVAVEALRRAEKDAQGAEMGFYEMVARRLLAQQVAGDTGKSLMSQADAWCQKEGVVRPERLQTLAVPLPSR